MKYWHCMWQAGVNANLCLFPHAEILFQPLKCCFQRLPRLEGPNLQDSRPSVFKVKKNKIHPETIWLVSIDYKITKTYRSRFPANIWWTICSPALKWMVLYSSEWVRGGGLVGLLAGSWRSAARCLLHHWAWHVAPALTTARFLHSPSTAGTVHPPDPASSSQNKLCFVPPTPLAGTGSLYA